MDNFALFPACKQIKTKPTDLAQYAMSNGLMRGISIQLKMSHDRFFAIAFF
jgi:hypothetical protein